MKRNSSKSNKEVHCAELKGRHVDVNAKTQTRATANQEKATTKKGKQKCNY